MPTTIRAIYENGILRPLEPVDLPDGCEVEFEPRFVNPVPGVAASTPSAQFGTAEGRRKVYAILSERFESGHHDTAERHNEHQP